MRGAGTLAQPSIGAVIKLGPGYNLYQAIKAANTDRRVGRWCKPERPDHGLSLNNPAQPLAEAMPTQCKMARPYEIFDLTDDPKPKLG